MSLERGISFNQTHQVEAAEVYTNSEYDAPKIKVENGERGKCQGNNGTTIVAQDSEETKTVFVRIKDPVGTTLFSEPFSYEDGLENVHGGYLGTIGSYGITQVIVYDSKLKK